MGIVQSKEIKNNWFIFSSQKERKINEFNMQAILFTLIFETDEEKCWSLYEAYTQK